jgi:Protein affecting phage T7 exclusion by the F plasmid
VSGAALVIGAFLLLLPGFLTDVIGLLLMFPMAREMIFQKVSSKYREKNKFIDGEYKDFDEK